MLLRARDLGVEYRSGRETVVALRGVDLEREVFLSLCGTDGTKARLQHFLQTGKPLRN